MLPCDQLKRFLCDTKWLELGSYILINKIYIYIYIYIIYICIYIHIYIYIHIIALGPKCTLYGATLQLCTFGWVTPGRCVHVAGVDTAPAVTKFCQGPSTAGYIVVPCPRLWVKTPTTEKVEVLHL